MSEIMRQIWTPQMQMAFTIVVLLIVCLYALSIVWISRDARLRGESPMKWMIIGLIPGAGIIAYLLLRPPMLAMDRDEQELEVALKQRELMRYGECVQCGYPVKDDYILCPNCQTQLRNLCTGCGRPLEPSWPVCPYCTTPVEGQPEVTQTTVSKPKRRRSSVSGSQNRSRSSTHTTHREETQEQRLGESHSDRSQNRPTKRKSSQNLHSEGSSSSSAGQNSGSTN